MSWPVVKMSEIFDIARGGSPRPIDQFITDAPDGVNWIMIGDTKGDSKYIDKTAKKIKPEGVKKSREVKKGDFLLTNSMSFGRPYILRTSGCIHDGWLVLSPKTDQIFTDYFYHYLGSTEVKNKLASKAAGAVVKNLNKDIVKDLEIPLPPFEEQKRIAAILDKADSVRRKRQQAIDLADDFLRSVFLDMFGDPIANNKKWNIMELGELAPNKGDMVDGPFGSSVNTKTDYIDDGEIPVIRTKNVSLSGKFITDDLKFMTREKYETIIRSNVVPGDIVLTKVGTIGNVCIFPQDFQEAVLSTTGSCRIRVDESRINKTYLYYFLKYYRPKMHEIASAGVQPFLNMKHIKGFKVPMPDKELQERFADVVNRTTGSKTLLNESSKFKLFESLSQKAFAGEL